MSTTQCTVRKYQFAARMYCCSFSPFFVPGFLGVLAAYLEYEIIECVTGSLSGGYLQRVWGLRAACLQNTRSLFGGDRRVFRGYPQLY